MYLFNPLKTTWELELKHLEAIRVAEYNNIQYSKIKVLSIYSNWGIQ